MTNSLRIITLINLLAHFADSALNGIMLFLPAIIKLHITAVAIGKHEIALR